MLQEQTTLTAGTSIEGANGESYIVEALLGQGGFSAVYRVREQNGRKGVFALKEIIDPNPQKRHDLALEAEILMNLDHPSLPHVYQVFENAKLNRIFMLMDFIDGKNLEVLRQEQPEQRFSLPMVLALLTPIVDAISYLHTRKRPIVHRDIKPANIIVPTKGADAQLVDFGLAKEHVEDKTTNVFRGGTPGYAAPEQYVKGTNQRTDVYALGATLYTLLTGSIPADALNRSVNQQDNDPFQSARTICPTVPEAISKIIDQAMSLRTASRFATVEEFWRTLCIAAIPDAAAGVSQRAVGQVNGEQVGLLNPVNGVVPSQVSKPSATLALTQPIAPSHYSKTTFWRIVLLLIALFIVITGSLSIWFSSILPSSEGSRASQISSAAGKHTGTSTSHHISSTIISATVSAGKNGSASSTSIGNLHSSTPLSLPTPASTSAPSSFPTPTSVPAPSSFPTPTSVPAATVDCISPSSSTLTFTSLRKGTNPPSQTLTLTNCGGESGWTASLQTTDGSNWLTVSPSQGTITFNGSQDVQVMVQNNSLAYGTYQGSILFSQGTSMKRVIIVNNVQKKADDSSGAS